MRFTGTVPSDLRPWVTIGSAVLLCRNGLNISCHRFALAELEFLAAMHDR